ncbi:MAG TPA: hypothetical protein VHK69_18075, partial [Chitinophagaceae bacterium]|nr:hypothetical protein [Chitinophagaceae bacterium]
PFFTGTGFRGQATGQLKGTGGWSAGFRWACTWYLSDGGDGAVLPLVKKKMPFFFALQGGISF